jgi:hypothetical protein
VADNIIFGTPVIFVSLTPEQVSENLRFETMEHVLAVFLGFLWELMLYPVVVHFMFLILLIGVIGALRRLFNIWR